jgi:hypothetical protein
VALSARVTATCAAMLVCVRLPAGAVWFGWNFLRVCGFSQVVSLRTEIKGNSFVVQMMFITICLLRALPAMRYDDVLTIVAYIFCWTAFCVNRVSFNIVRFKA